MNVYGLLRVLVRGDSKWPPRTGAATGSDSYGRRCGRAARSLKSVLLCVGVIPERVAAVTAIVIWPSGVRRRAHGFR